MADISMPNRLVRKRNSNLQKQLDVTLQILSEEFRQTKERMYKEERDCGKFLQSLYSTVPGLHTYGQPNTRAMNTNSMLRERRYSVTMSILSGSDDDDPQDPLASSFNSSGKPRPQSTSGITRQAEADAARARRGSITDSTTSSKPAPRSDRNAFAKKLRENNPFLKRPQTAGGSQKSHQNSGQQDGGPEKPVPSRLIKQSREKYGRGAYSEHDRFVQDKVRKRFDVIFDPETESRKVNLNAPATPAVFVESLQNGNMEGRISTTPRIPHPHINVITVNGEEFHLTQKPQNHRRVVWSAQPRKRQQKQRAGSAPHSAREKWANGSDGKESSQLHSSSASAMTSTRAQSATARRPSITHPARPESRVQFLEESLADRWDNEENLVESSSENDDDMDDETREEAEIDVSQSQRPQSAKKSVFMNHQADSKLSEDQKPESAKKPSSVHNPKGQSKVTTQNTRQSEQTHLSTNHSLQTSTTHHHHHHYNNKPPHSTRADSSKFLKVPGSTSHPNKQQTNDPTTSEPTNAPRPSSRLSNTSDKSPPKELWSRLMKAGLQGVRSSRQRPKTAPTKSELSHRSVPAPRQTVVGILAQIENQKASTRNLLNTSKELQRAVKKLVPWEQAPKYSMDDW